MQASAPVALSAPVTASPTVGKPLPAPANFGDELTKLLAAITSIDAAANAATATAVVAVSSKTATAADGSPATGTAPRHPRCALAAAMAVPEIPDTPTPMPADTDAAAAAQATPPPADQATAVPLPVPPPVTAGLDAAPGKPSSAPDTATVRSRTATTAHRDADTESADTAAAARIPEPVLPPPVAIPVTAPLPPVVSAPVGAAEPHTPPAAASPVAIASERPVAPPADAPQPGAASAMHHDVATDPDATPQPVTVPGAMIAPTPSPAATTSLWASASTQTPGTAHPSPAAQLAPALVSMGHTGDGVQRLTLKLQPPELGQVQIQIDRPTDAPARVAITVERPETLLLLLHDQPQLQRALDQAGVPAEGRSVTFHVATPEPAARTETAMAPTPAGFSAAMGGDLSHGASRQDGRPMRPGAPVDAPGASDDDGEFQTTGVMPMNWVRAGLDITA